MYLRGPIEKFLDIFSTHACRVCRRPVKEDIGQRYLCVYCYEAALHSIYSSMKPDPELEIYFATDYESWARDLMRDYKYRSPYLVEFWSKLLSDYVSREWLDIFKAQKQIYIASVPLHINKLRVRTFDQAELLATRMISKLSKSIKLEFLPQLLIRHKDTEHLYSLSASQREEGLKDAFKLNPIYKANPEFRNSCLLLIDDISTTGASFRYCAKTVASQLMFKHCLAIAATGRNLS